MAPNIPIITSDESDQIGAPEVRASGADFGSQVGSALQGLGGQIEDSAGIFDQLQKQQRQQDVANLTANFDYTKRFLDNANAAGPGAKGFYAGTKVDFDNAVQEYTASIKDDKTRLAVQQNLMQKKPATVADAASHEITATQDLNTADANTALSTVQNKVRTDPTQFDSALTDGIGVINAQPGLNADTKLAMQTKYTSDLAGARFDTLTNAATTADGLASIRKDLESDQWQKRMSADEFKRQETNIDNQLTHITAGQSAQVGAVLDDLGKRNGDPTKQIPIAELQAADPIITQFGTPTQKVQWAQIVTQQNTYRQEAGLPPAVVQQRRAVGEHEEGVQAQYAFVQDELQGSEGSAGRALANATTVEDATKAAIGYERPRGWSSAHPENGDNYAGRLANAQRLAKGTNITPAETDAMAYFTSQGWSVVQAAGLVGNLVGESNLRPGAVGDNGISIGVGQWNGDRQKRFLAFVGDFHADNNSDISDAGQARNDARDKIIKAQQDAAQNDMMTYWAGVNNPPNGIQLQPLGDDASFKQRGADALLVAQYANIAKTDATPLTKPEVTQMTQAIKDGSADDTLSLMSKLQLMGPDMAHAAYKQLGVTSPSFEYAAQVNEDTPAVAAHIVRGQKMIDAQGSTQLDTLSGNGGTGQTRQSDFNSVAGQALRGMNPNSVAAAQQAATAYYLDTKGSAGAYDSSAYQDAVRKVLPPVGNVNGQPTVLPPGVSSDEFNTALDGMTDADYVQFSMTKTPPFYMDGTQAKASDIAYEGKMRAIDDAGHYKIEMGDGGFLLTGRMISNGVAEPYIFAPDPQKLKNIAATYVAPSQPLAAKIIDNMTFPEGKLDQPGVDQYRALLEQQGLDAGTIDALVEAAKEHYGIK